MTFKPTFSPQELLNSAKSVHGRYSEHSGYDLLKSRENTKGLLFLRDHASLDMQLVSTNCTSCEKESFPKSYMFPSLKIDLFSMFS